MREERRYVVEYLIDRWACGQQKRFYSSHRAGSKDNLNDALKAIGYKPYSVERIYRDYTD